jgi:tRNA threonylcarbamoyladenosine biosynthesis protein TsaB
MSPDNGRFGPARPLNLLAFDTSTDILRVAVARGDAVREEEGPGGAHASATLLPTIMRMLGDAGLALRDLDAIAFGRGPGSFTGLRTACSVAQGLAFGANVPLLPVDTLLAVAEEARHAFGARQVVAVLDARMDQLYAARYDFDAAGALGGDDEPLLLSPEALDVPAGWALAGNAFAAYGPRLAPASARHEVLPTATAMLRLAPALLAAGRTVPAEQAWPLYVRDKVAQTTEERAAIKAAAAAAAVVPPATA